MVQTYLHAQRRSVSFRAAELIPQARSGAGRLERSRAAERARFGLPAWQILSCGFVGVLLAAQFWLERYHRHSPPALTHVDALDSAQPLVDEAHAAALLQDVRRVLARHGLDLGETRLRLRMTSVSMEGITFKSIRPPPTGRKVDEIRLAPGMQSLHAACTLAHEFMHAWLWLQDFPPLPSWLEEGLCELASYLYLLSLLHEPTGSVLRCTAVEIRAELHAIERNALPQYGAGFRACAASLQGRQLHQLLGFVKEYAALPPHM